MPAFPTELFVVVFEELAEDVATVLVLRKVSRLFQELSRPYVFSKLVFRDDRDFLDFVALMASPACTIPQPLRCKHLHFKNPTAISHRSTAAQALYSIIVESSLALSIIDNRIPKAIARAPPRWKEAIRRLAINGGRHRPSSLFAFLSEFPSLELLQLTDVHMKAPKWSEPTHYSFPPGMTRLWMSQCSSLWTFFRSHVVPRGGLAGIRGLFVRGHFSMNPGVLDIFHCFNAPELEALQHITLDATYAEDDPHRGEYLRLQLGSLLTSCPVDIDIARILVPSPFMKMRGLKHLRLNVANLPSTVATNFLGWCTVYPHSHTLEVIDVHVPQSGEQWPDGDPSKELRVFLAEMGACDPALIPPSNSKASLVIRGFPGVLPQHTNTWGGSMVCFPSEFSLCFRECNWEQTMEWA